MASGTLTTQGRGSISARRGREQRRRGHTARARQPDLTKFYRHRLPDVAIDPVEWQLTLLRPKQPPIDIGSTVESFTWSESSSALTGNLQCHRPDATDPASLPISHAQRIRCRVHWGPKSWYELWTMRTKPPVATLESDLVSIDLEDDMTLLKGSKRNWAFRSTKHRKHGYHAHEVALLVARRAGLRVGKLAKGKHRFSKLVMRNATPLDVIRKAYANEHSAGGRSFVIRIRNGRLEVVPFARNSLLYVLNRQIQSGTVQAQPKSAEPFTVLTGHAKLGKGKHAKKIRHTALDRRAVARLGYMHRDKDYGTVKSGHELASKVKRDLANGLKIEHTADITHTGIPFVRRGDGVQLDLPREGFRKQRSFVFADTVDHSVSSAGYTTEFTFTSKDPYVAQAEKARKEAKQRAKKRAQRNRRRSHK